MPLDDLVQVIETIQQRIRDHGDSLRQNEIRTRVALIDPLLTALGWDVADPGLVTAEYDVSGRRADYALLGTGNIPAATLEAKKLNESLEPHRLQMLNYSNAAGIRFAGLTDGNRWEFYEIFKQGTLDERRILEAGISNEPSSHLALRFLLLWRSNLETGRGIHAEWPVFKPDPEDGRKDPEIHPSPVGNWKSLADIQDAKDFGPPAILWFPSEGERNIKAWRDVLRQVAEWQVRVGNLRADRCPIWSSPNAKKRYIVSTNPVHDGGTNFRNPHELTNGCFLEVHGWNWALEGSKMILDALGVSAESVQIKQN